MRILTSFLLFLWTICASAQPKPTNPDEPFVMYDERGQVSEQLIVKFENGGSVKRHEWFWPNGQIKVMNETTSINGGYKQHIQNWGENGIMTKDAFTDATSGKSNQAFQEWYPDGKMARKMDRFSNGDSVSYSLWFQNGTLARVFSNCKSQLHGVYTEYDSLGMMRIRGNYTHGVRDGEYQEWNEAGKLTFKNTYVMGTPQVVLSRNKNRVSIGCKPVLYSQSVCHSVGEWTRMIADDIVKQPDIGDNDDERQKMVSALGSIWNFMSIKRPDAFFLNLESYRDGYNRSRVSAKPVGGATLFMFGASDDTRKKQPQSFTLLYYPDGSIEVPSDMTNVSMYETGAVLLRGLK